MNATEELILADLNNHIKVHDIHYVNKGNILFACEIDRIQSVARGIVTRIVKQYGKYEITSSTKNVTKIGYTKVFICKMKDKVKNAD